ncbi:MAG: HAD family phosphatase [Candidatus Micrarchaeota archaeon]
MELKAVLFDLDGTLIDSIPLHKKSFQLLFYKFGRRLPEKSISQYIRWSTEEIYRKLKVAQKLGLPIETFLRLRREIYWGLVKKKKNLEFKSRTAFLKKLKKQGFKLALVTNSSRQTTERTTPKRVLKLFDCIATFSEVLHGKPAPDLLQFACRKMKLNPAECIMVGDSIVDLKAAESAKIRGIGFWGKTGASSFSDLKKEKPFKIVKTVRKLKSVLDSLGK